MLVRPSFSIHRVLFYIGFCFAALSCKTTPSTDTNYAYVGGEIVNPKNSNVVLYNPAGDLVDSLTLDRNNRFICQVKNLKSGIYLLTHGGEYQAVLLEPNDSIMFRLNTYDFDESLVFTGHGAKKNNYLIKTYLTNEAEAKKLVSYATKLAPDAFSDFIEKRRQSQLDEFKRFLEVNPESEFFRSIIESNINYNSYADKEIYPFAHFGNNKLVHIKDLPKNFFEHRHYADYNASHLSHFFSYNRFLFSHIDNIAIKSYYATHPYHSKFDRHSLDYNKSKLDLIDSIISDDMLKNNLLKYKTKDFVSNNHTEAEAHEMLQYFLKKSTNEADKDDMRDLVASLKLLRQGNPLPRLTLINYDNSQYELNHIISKPTIIYFWSSNSKMQYRNSHYKVKKLKSNYPFVDFISINLNANDDKSWKAIIDNYDFPTTNEYKFKDVKSSRKTLAVNYLNKAIIVNENGTILYPNVNIFKSDFTEILDKLQEKKHLIVNQ